MTGAADGVIDLNALALDDVHALAEPLLLVSCEELLTAIAKLDAEVNRRLQALDVRDVTSAECGRTTRGWLVEEQHLSPAEARRRLWIAKRCCSYPAIEDAFAAGDINIEHVRVMLSCLGKLRGDWQDAAQDELLAFAREHDPAMLAELCRAIRIRSGADESAEAAAQRRYEARHLSLASTIDGMMSINGLLDPESAATLNAALAPLMGRAGDVDDRSKPQRCADALTDLARMSLSYGELPDHGGERPQIVATLPFSELRDGLTAGQTSAATLNGLPSCPTTARRLSCDANIIPAVLGSHGEVLDLGRSTPTWSRAQRRARRIEDKGCVFPNCQAPLDRCQIHHLHHWSHGGCTDKNNGAHLCHYHHRLVHHSNWTIYRNHAGKIEVQKIQPSPQPLQLRQPVQLKRT